MSKPLNLRFLLALTIALILLNAWLVAHHVALPWANSITYIKDERTKACFAVRETFDSSIHYGPYFSYVPCELVDNADWQYYEKRGR